MAWTARALSICLSIPNVASIPLLAASNITLPDNVTNHGEPNLLCTPSTGYTVFSFMLANYVMHAATTQTFPGESPFHQLLTFVTALLFPAAGVSRGLNTIARGILVTVNQKHGDLQKAAAAGALCMVVRTENWRPVIGHAIHGAIAHRSISSQAVRWRIYRPKWLHSHRLSPGWQFTDDVPRGHTFESLRRIHGAAKALPIGYAYACVPPNAMIASPLADPTIRISASLNSAKIIVAIFQTIVSTYTFYNARQDLIKQFGYASFSLTVVPYTIMSVVNLLGSLLMPAYSSVFVVRSEVMDELEHRYGKRFDGTVGALVPLTLGAPIQLASSDDAVVVNDKSRPVPRDAVVLESKPHEADPDISIPACAPFQCRPSASLPIWLKRIRKAFPRAAILPAGYDLSVLMNFILCLLVVVGVPLGIIGGLSSFNAGNSTLAQRVWTMTWLACGCVYGLGFGFRMSYGSPFIDTAGNPQVAMWIDLGIRTVAAVPAIGGMVVVAQMIMAYGDCIVF